MYAMVKYAEINKNYSHIIILYNGSMIVDNSDVMSGAMQLFYKVKAKSYNMVEISCTYMDELYQYSVSAPQFILTSNSMFKNVIVIQFRDELLRIFLSRITKHSLIEPPPPPGPLNIYINMSSTQGPIQVIMSSHGSL